MSLIENLKNEIGDNVINQISEKLGVSNQQADAAVNASIPVTLASLLKNNDSLSGSGFLGNLFSNVSNNIFSTDEVNAGSDSWLDKGKALVGSVFGSNTSEISNALASHTGISADKSSSLLPAILPLITGAISKLVLKNGWSISDFVTKLWASKSEISAALPPNLSTSLGLAGLTPPVSDIPHLSTPVVETPVVELPKVERPIATEPRVERPAVSHETEKKSSFWAWLIPLLLIALALWYFLGRNGSDKMSVVGDSTTNVIDTTVNVVKGKLNEAGDYLADLGDTISKKLPNGSEIAIGTHSVENHLIDFIEDKDKAIDKETWFTFDRLFFETGKSTLKPESQNQLDHIAAILKAYPNVKLKLGGYTDNTGDAAINKTVSNDRANTAMKALVSLGIDASRLEAEGYGAEHPVATNETEEGRAQNRRIDVRVTSK